MKLCFGVVAITKAIAASRSPSIVNSSHFKPNSESQKPDSSGEEAEQSELLEAPLK